MITPQEFANKVSSCGFFYSFPLGRLSVANGSEITGPFSLAPLDL